jgi:TrmH family RNA methyltransferase
VKRVILCRPTGPRNLGTVVRAAANFGPVEVAVVRPILPSLLVHPDFEQMSHGVEELVDRVMVFDCLDDALADCHDSVGFSARPRHHRITLPWPEVLPRCLASSVGEHRLGLVFGTEESGLSGEEEACAQVLTHIATSSEHTSLNLSVAVSLVLYALFSGESPPEFERIRAPLTGMDRAYLKAHVAETLSDKATSTVAGTDIVASVERVFSHAEIETRDARSWHTIMRALGNRKTPLDYGLEGSPKEARRKAAIARALTLDPNAKPKNGPTQR